MFRPRRNEEGTPKGPGQGEPGPFLILAGITSNASLEVIFSLPPCQLPSALGEVAQGEHHAGRPAKTRHVAGRHNQDTASLRIRPDHGTSCNHDRIKSIEYGNGSIEPLRER